MESDCPRCGSKNEIGESQESNAPACATCGAALKPAVRASPLPARAAPGYDGYAVGRRVLRVAPAWILLSVAGFVLVLLFFSWASRPVGKAGETGEEVFKNEATNQPPARDARAAGQGSKTSAARGEAVRMESGVGEAGAATPALTPGGEAGQGAFAVQVGAFADLSQANEQVSRLRAAGFDARVEESGAATRFRFLVRSGRLATREEATRLAAQLRARRLADETVIVEPSG
ncbi:MAG TPA: SPOR domain-containing protein [Pyrinomonadaceae bacterium]|jgi:cell division septation protein DedD|nr:SPOR domain-containing protein [Pyrinomonadaceae bacterium]